MTTALWLLLFGGTLGLLVLLADVRIRKRWRMVAAGLFAIVVLGLARELAEDWPLPAIEISRIRLMIAAVTIVAILRLRLVPRESASRQINALLGLLAVLALACFYNFGAPQFRDYRLNRSSYVHTWDARVYFPTAKYFDELGYDGVYLASVAAYLDATGQSTEDLARLRLRDLETYRIVRAGDAADALRDVRERFSAERWSAFSSDMRWFWSTMSVYDYLGSLRDHGANATPVWLTLAHVLFRWAPVSEQLLYVTALIDPTLLALLFFAIGRSFGFRTALICMIVFGTTAFPMFGSNWAGATLRFAWLAALGFAICALKSERWYLGGALLAGAVMLRVLPVLGCAFLAAPALWRFADSSMRTRALPSIGELRRAHRPLGACAVGGLVCAVTLFVGSSALLSFASWGDWWDKVRLHAVKPNINHVGLRTIVSFDPDLTIERLEADGYLDVSRGWEESQRATFAEHERVYVAVAALFVLLVFAACRGAPLHRSALLGMLLVPVVLYPANYYLHYVFLLPLLADEKTSHASTWTWCSLVLLALSGAQYFTLAEPVDVRFTEQSWMLLAAFAAMLVPLAANSLTVENCELQRERPTR